MAEIRVNATGELKLYDSDDSNGGKVTIEHKNKRNNEASYQYKVP